MNLFKKPSKIKIQIIFDIETGDLALEFKPDLTRPSKILLILAHAQDIIEASLKQAIEEKKSGYIQ